MGNVHTYITYTHIVHINTHIIVVILHLIFNQAGRLLQYLLDTSINASAGSTVVNHGNGGYYIIFLAYRHFKILGKYPKTPKTTCPLFFGFYVTCTRYVALFWVRLMDFGPESPASGLEKWITGFFRDSGSGNQKSTFLHPRKVTLYAVRESALLCLIFLHTCVQNAP